MLQGLKPLSDQAFAGLKPPPPKDFSATFPGEMVTLLQIDIEKGESGERGEGFCHRF